MLVAVDELRRLANKLGEHAELMPKLQGYFVRPVKAQKPAFQEIPERPKMAVGLDKIGDLRGGAIGASRVRLGCQPISGRNPVAATAAPPQLHGAN